MTRTLIAALLAAAVVAGPVSASDMLAKSLGVDPGALTVSELVALKNAIDTDDHNRAQAILAKADDGDRWVITGFSDKGMNETGAQRRAN